MSKPFVPLVALFVVLNVVAPAAGVLPGPCTDTALLVDECGDTVTGTLTLEAPLVLAEGQPVRFPGGDLVGTDALRYQDAVLCAAYSTYAGCVGPNATDPAWRLVGNAGTDPAQHFLGTTDAQPLEVRVNGSRALRLEPGATPNVVGGLEANEVMGGAIGATIGGGGLAPDLPNRVSDDYGTVGGGAQNLAGDFGDPHDAAFATVGGGQLNWARPRTRPSQAGSRTTSRCTPPGVSSAVDPGTTSKARSPPSAAGKGTRATGSGRPSGAAYRTRRSRRSPPSPGASGTRCGAAPPRWAGGRRTPPRAGSLWCRVARATWPREGGASQPGCWHGRSTRGPSSGATPRGFASPRRPPTSSVSARPGASGS